MIIIERSGEYIDWDGDLERFENSSLPYKGWKIVDSKPEPTIYTPSYQELRLMEYPDFREYLDSIVKISSDDENLKSNGHTQLNEYITKCLKVKEKYPKKQLDNLENL